MTDRRFRAGHGAARAPLVLVAGLLAGLVAALAPAPLGAQRVDALVVTGLGGEPAFTERFREWGSGLVDAVRAGGGRAVWLAERADLHPDVAGVARKDAVARAVASLAEGEASSSDVVLVALFGHGSARGGEARLNLPGPDLTPGDLAAWLEPLAPRRVVVVNGASASGGFLEALSAPGRVVITATRSAGEAQATRFGGHFVDALSGAAADTDKDGRVSLLEAFEYARLEVAREFATAGALPTEHALLEDDGDGVGSLEPGGSDGALAATIVLGRTGAVAAGAGDPAGAEPAAGPPADSAADPALRSLLAEKARLERELADLRRREGQLPEAEYRAALEALLLEIARNGRAIREHDPAAPDGRGGRS